jgi:hypothetical protein
MTREMIFELRILRNRSGCNPVQLRKVTSRFHGEKKRPRQAEDIKLPLRKKKENPTKRGISAGDPFHSARKKNLFSYLFHVLYRIHHARTN